MSRPPLVLQLELECRDDDGLRGTVTGADGRAVAFGGWLELAGVLEEELTRSGPSVGSGGADALDARGTVPPRA